MLKRKPLTVNFLRSYHNFKARKQCRRI